MGAARAHVDRVKRLAGRHEQAIAFVPPKQTLAQISGSRIMPDALPSGAKTWTPS